jgi:transcriptional regulator with XRE-family HTH domain
VKTLGQLIAQRRKELGLKQIELAALLKNREGEPLSFSYFNYLERDRGLPPDYLLDQIAAGLKMPLDVVYFWARRMPPDLEPPGDPDPRSVQAAYRAFRQELKRGRAKKRPKSRR